MENVLQTIYSQFQDSPTIVRLIENFNAYIDPRVNLNNFYQSIWDINTASGYGLDLWGRIVGVTRVLTVPTSTLNFGFNDGGVKDYAPFGQAPFRSGTPPVTSNYSLSDTAFRALIMTKALANISATTCPALNALLQVLFPGRGRCYVNDLGNMQMRYVFEFALQPYELSILENSGAVPRPTGVGVWIVVAAPPTSFFGFSEAGPNSQPFGQAPFYPGAINAS